MKKNNIENCLFINELFSPEITDNQRRDLYSGGNSVPTDFYNQPGPDVNDSSPVDFKEIIDADNLMPNIFNYSKDYKAIINDDYIPKNKNEFIISLNVLINEFDFNSKEIENFWNISKSFIKSKEGIK